ncbi:unnamed protein product, partial [Rotaria magnacalcarata]
NLVRFGDGLFLKEYVDDEQLHWLSKFYTKIEELIKRDISKALKFGTEQRPLIVIEKPPVVTSDILFRYAASTIDILFDNSSIKDNIEATIIDDKFPNMNQILKKTSNTAKNGITNSAQGLLSKVEEKTIRLTNAIDNLIKFGLLKKGIGRDRHIVTARKETYMKVPPATIRSSTNMLSYLQSIGINIDTYEHFYPSSPLPTDMQLTEFAVNMIVSNADSIEISHLFNDA